MKLYSPKTIKIGDTFLHFWYANNRGRGCDNVSILATKQGDRDAARSVDGRIRTVGFCGLVKIPAEMCTDLGIDYNELKNAARDLGILR